MVSLIGMPLPGFSATQTGYGVPGATMPAGTLGFGANNLPALATNPLQGSALSPASGYPVFNQSNHPANWQNANGAAPLVSVQPSDNRLNGWQQLQLPAAAVGPVAYAQTFPVQPVVGQINTQPPLPAGLLPSVPTAMPAGKTSMAPAPLRNPNFLPPLLPPPESMAPWLYFAPKTQQPSQLVPAVNGAAAGPYSPTGAGTGLPSSAAQALQDPSDLSNPAAKGLKAEKASANVGADTGPQVLTLLETDPGRASLKSRLESTGANERSGAAEDFFEILQGKPSLADNPEIKPFVDAFSLLILRDPISYVHEPVYRAIDVGILTNPSPEVMSELQRLAQTGGGLFGLDSSWARSSLSNLGARASRNAQQAQASNQPAAAATPLASSSAPGPLAANSGILGSAAASNLPAFNTPPLAATKGLNPFSLTSNSPGLPPATAQAFTPPAVLPIAPQAQASAPGARLNLVAR